MRRLCAALLLACGAPVLAAPQPAPPLAASLPQLGDVARVDLTPAQERKVGEEIMNDIRRDRDYLDDAPLLEYLNNFGQNLVAALPSRPPESPDYFFFCVRDPQLNAFALPGGFIAVHSALLLAAQSESELASVMAHEIGHVVQRHIARSIGKEKQDVVIPLAAMFLAALAAKSNPDAAMGVYMGGQGLAIQRQLNFSRDVEREADRVGFQIMGAAGFDTSGMVAFFGRLQASTRLFPDIPPALLSHPLTTERIADIQARIRETPYKQRADSLDFYLVRARARVLQDESTTGREDAQKTFESMLHNDSRWQQVAAQYGLAFLALRRGQPAQAQEWLDKARATLAAPPRPGVFSATPAPAGNSGAIFAALDIDIKLAPGQPKAVLQDGVKAAAKATADYPLSRGIARQYAQALIANGQLEEAARYLRDQVQLYRSEPKLYDLLAKTYAEQGKIALQHLALAESYALSGGTLGALDQLGLARKARDASFYDMSVIDARERELQAKRRDEIKEKKEGL
ncbi:MAG: beta-barrel assembly-enhancing protease [Telluria sp.]